MIEKIAISFSRSWGESLNAPEEDVACFRYGLEALLSTIFNIAIMFVVAVLLQRPFLVFPYIFVYVPMRMYAGGFHASSHFRCISFSCALFFVCGIAAKYSEGMGFAYVCLGILLLSIVISFKLVPVMSPNKPLTKKQIITAKRNVKIMLGMLAIFWCSIWLKQAFNSYTIMCFYAELSVVFTLVIGWSRQGNAKNSLATIKE